MSKRMIAALLMMSAIPALAADTTIDQQEAAADLQQRAALRRGESTVKTASNPSVPSDDSKMKPGEVTPAKPAAQGSVAPLKPDQAQGSGTGM